MPNSKNNPRGLFLLRSAALLAAIPGAGAAEYALDDATVRVNGLLTLGTGVRTEGRDPVLIPKANGSTVGVPGFAAGGRNSDDGDLNYGRGDAFSTVLKGYLDVDASRGNLGAFARIKAWHDYTPENDAVPWGNTTDNHAAHQPLSDRGFATRAKFTGALVEDAYLRDSFQVDGKDVEARLGRQTIGWGSSFFIPGGLSAITPVDQVAAKRPGNVIEETRIAIQALSAKIDFKNGLAAQVFQQYGFEASVQNPCGTFYSTADYTTPGCNRVFIGNGSDRTSQYINSADTQHPNDANQFGAGLTYQYEPLGTEIGLYAAQYHSRLPFVSFIKNSNPGNAPVLASNQDSTTNARYFLEYPDQIRMFGLSLTRKSEQTVFTGELTYRPNQPAQLNNGDLRNAFTSNSTATPLRSAATETAPGAVFHGYDRFQTAQLQVGAIHTLGRTLGAESGTLWAESAVKYIAGLPDVESGRRYGRKDVFGSGPVNNVCVGDTMQCSNAGYVSTWSWGYRLRGQLVYTGLIDGVTLKPSVTYTRDVSGWSADDVFIQGRKVWTTALRAEFGRGHYTRLEWQRIDSKGYDITRDRDAVAFVIGTTL